tara:strand:+ start:1469 stop:1690 length:222 start_codon:yes stop_codon:yes gene_type:complete
MKIHATIDKDGHHVFHPSRKQAIDLINSDHERFPNAIGNHYKRLTVGTKIADIVALLNAGAFSINCKHHQPSL